MRKNNKINSRNMFAAITAGIMLCAGSVQASEKPTLNFYTWADYISQDVLKAFKAETGSEVVLQVYDSTEIMQAKMLTGHSGYDLVITASDTLGPQLKAGVYAKLDKSKLSNYANLDPEILKQMANIDAGNEHAVPYLFGTTGVVYEEQAVRKALGDMPFPDNPLALIFEPEYAKRLQSCGVSLMDSPFETMPMMLHYLGRPVSNPSADDIEAATQQLLKVTPYVRQFTSMITVNLASGNLCAAMGYSGDAALGNQRLIDAKSPLRLSYAYDLKKGTKLWVDNFAIPADAKNPQLALQFIDFILRPENAAKIANELQYATPNKAATALLDPAFVANPYQFPEASVQARLYPVNLSQKEQRTMTRAFNKLRSAAK